MPRTAPLLLAAFALALSFGLPATAQDNPVRIVVPAPPGGTLDSTARILAQRLTVVTGETHVVENKPGANTIIGTDYVIRSQPDGRTMLYTGTGLVISALLQKLAFEPLQDLRPVMAISTERYALVRSAQLPAASAQALRNVAASRPGGVNCAAPPGPMTLACEQLKARIGGAVTIVPYPGIAPALAALAGGHVDVTFVAVQAVGKVVDAKLAHVLAVSERTGSRDGLGADAAIISEVWPGFVLDSIQGIYLPARTPEERVRQLHRDLARILAEPETIARIAAAGQDPVPSDSPENFARQMENLSARYTKVVKDLGLSGR